MLQVLLLVGSVVGLARGTEHTVACETTAGPLNWELDDSLSPSGVARVLELVEDNFFDEMIFYRVIPGFLTQFGVPSDPKQFAKWNPQQFDDEPNLKEFKRGTISYAGAGVNSRSCHLFIAFGPGHNGLGKGTPHETTLGYVTTETDATLDAIQSNYKAAAYSDLTSLQGKIGRDGNKAASAYPKLDKIKHCKMIKGGVHVLRQAQVDARKTRREKARQIRKEQGNL